MPALAPEAAPSTPWTPPHSLLFEPILERWVHNTHRLESSHSFAPGVIEAVLRGWQINALYTLHLRPLICHLNLLSRESSLAGATPEERYVDYCDNFSARHAAEFDSCFPELASLRPTVLAEHAAALGLLVRAIDSDRDVIWRRFGIPANALVTRIEGSGDTHDGAQRVTVLEFDNGAHIVYKPRSVSGELGWSRLSRWLTTRSPFSFPFANALDRGPYGWVEFIPELPKKDQASLMNNPEFLRQGGRLVAVMHALNAKDMHRDNLRITQDGPLPLDLETVLHSPLAAGCDYSPDDVTVALSGSVSWSGILPTAVSLPDSAGWSDVGFLATEAGGGSAVRYLTVRNPFRDDMSLTFEAEETWEHPYEKRSKDDSVAAASAVAAGFEETYRWLADHKDQFADVVRACFGTAKLRYLNAMTQDYVNTLRLSCSAEAMSDSHVRVERLRRIATLHEPPVPSLVEAEVQQLRLGHIPYFLMHASSTAVTDTQGQELATVSTSPIASAESKIQKLSQDDLRQQLDLIWSAFVALHPDNHLRQGKTASHASCSSSTTLTQLADELADDLTRRARPDGSPEHAPTWLSPVPSTDMIRPWAPGPLGFDLYSGRTGVGLALARAAVVLDHKPSKDLATAIFEACSRSLAHELPELSALVGTGLWTGTPGIAVALWHAGLLLDRSDWKDNATVALTKITPPAGLDIIEGMAGWAIALDAAGPLSKSSEQFLNAVKFADTADATLNHSGYAHGAAGLLHALAKTSLPDAEVAEPIQRVLKYIESLRTDDGRNWKVSTFPSAETATAWCHGAPGIALGLAAAHSVRPSLVPTHLVDDAVDAMARDGFGRNLTLCHGDPGSWAIADWISTALGHDKASQLATAGAATLSAETIKGQLSDRRNRNSLNDTLMVGRAGVLLHLTSRLDPSLGSFPLTPILSGGIS